MNFEVTKREIIASISILAIILTIGIFISNKISDYNQDMNSQYNKAFKISNDRDMFNYAMKTNIGNAFIEGELEAIDSVNYKEDIKGEYMALERVKQKYTMHTRTVTTTVNGKTRTRIETYWTWDTVDVQKFKSKEIKFLGNTFSLSKFNLPDMKYIDTISGGHNIRYQYYGLESKFKATIFANLKDNTIVNDNVNVYKDKNINETLEIVTNDSPVVIFWIIWTIVIGVIIYIFVYLDNDWLNK